MVEIYLDVLIGLNLYITHALLSCCEWLRHTKAPPLRKGFSSLVGGLSSLLILCPDLPFAALTAVRLGLAGLLVLIAFGFGDWRRFIRQVILFFLVNFLFAGVMIGCWMLFTPPGMAIRNGVIYLHLSALTLILATIAASLAARGLSWLLWRQRPERLMEEVRLQMDGRTCALHLLVDTGNRLTSGGVPVIACTASRLVGLAPEAVLRAADDLSALAELSGSRWASRIRPVSCETAAGRKLLPAFQPDQLTSRDGRQLHCLIALTDNIFCDGEADGAAPPELFQS